MIKLIKGRCDAINEFGYTAEELEEAIEALNKLSEESRIHFQEMENIILGIKL